MIKAAFVLIVVSDDEIIAKDNWKITFLEKNKLVKGF